MNRWARSKEDNRHGDIVQRCPRESKLEAFDEAPFQGQSYKAIHHSWIFIPECTDWTNKETLKPTNSKMHVPTKTSTAAVTCHVDHCLSDLIPLGPAARLLFHSSDSSTLITPTIRDTFSMSSPVRMTREWHGSALPLHVTIPLPSPAELVRLCTKSHPLGFTIGMPYPDADSPVFWIKYCSSIIWNELAAQKMAHDGLGELNSPVKVPAVYYGCQVTVHIGDPDAWPQRRSYVVMEYIPGKTAAQRLKEATDDATKDDIYKQVALALSELHRIPVPQNSRPAAVNGETICNVLFYDNVASLHYRNVTELEQHFNAVRDALR